MKIPNIFAVSIVIAASQILNMSQSNSQTSNFSCENLSRYGLDRNSSDCLQNKPANLTGSSNTNPSKGFLNLSKHGVLALNQGKKGSWNIKDIKIYKDGIKASVGDGSVEFLAKNGLVAGNIRVLNIESVNLNQNSKNDIYNIKKGSCEVSNLGYPGRFLGFTGVDKFTFKVLSAYATDNVVCKALDNEGNELGLAGLVIVERTNN